MNDKGIRIPLLIDTGLLIAGLVVATIMYADVNRLKADQVPESRIVRVEEQLKALKESSDEQKRAIEELKRQQVETARAQEEAARKIIEAIRERPRG